MDYFTGSTSLSGGHCFKGGKSGDEQDDQNLRTAREHRHAHRWPIQDHGNSKPIVPEMIEVLNFRRPLGQFVGAIILAITVSIGIPTDGIAKDGDFQSVLLKAGCPTAKVETLSDSNGTVVYRANCFSSSHMIITVVCIKGTCSSAERSFGDVDDLG